MTKGLAIKVASGVLVVALVVVVALAISGVFNSNVDVGPEIANAECSVENTQVVRGIAVDKVFYFTSTNAITDIGSYVSVRANGEDVKLKISDKKDENGNYGFIRDGGLWQASVAYRVTLVGTGISFAEEAYANLTTFVFIVDAEEALECTLSANVQELTAGSFTVEPIIDGSNEVTKWTLTVSNLAQAYQDNVVFLYQSEIGAPAQKYLNSEDTFTSVSYKLDPNIQPSFDGSTYVATVIEADVDDVYDELNVHQKGIEITEETFIVDEDATLASVYNSDFFLSTVAYLYAEQLGKKEFKLSDVCSLKLEYSFKPGAPSYATFDLTLNFKGFLKSAKNATVTIKLANKVIPDASVNFQKDPKAFDVGIKVALETTLSIDGGFEYELSNTDDKNKKEANLALKNVTKNLADIIQDALGTSNDNDKSYIFATWYIPVGTLPIQIVENMGIEIKCDLKAKVGANAKNVVTVEFGCAYVDSGITPFANIADDFNMGMLTLQGTVETKFGLYNELGITACGIVSVNLGISFGVYLDIAGRLEMDGWSIVNAQFNIVPCYYTELGLYLDMSVNGKIWKFKLANKDFLKKKWPLWTAGYKYIPQDHEDDIQNRFCDETVYMNTNYFYFTTFEAYALDIQKISDAGDYHDIDWDEFDYEYDSKYLKMTDNKVSVAPTAPAEFETKIKVTSKINKNLSKEITVVKTPEMPTAIDVDQTYVKSSNKDVYYNVMLNTSKFFGISTDNQKVSEGGDSYTYMDDVLTIKSQFAESLGYGKHTVLFESSKGYVRLNLDVVSDKNIVPDNGFAPVTFDKSMATAAEFNMPLYGNAIETVGLDDNNWSYNESTGKFRVLAKYLSEVDAEKLSISIGFSNGETANLIVNIVDNRIARLNSNRYEYQLESGYPLYLDMDLYGNTITRFTKGSQELDADLINGNIISAAAFEGQNTGVSSYAVYCGSNFYEFSVEFGRSNMLIVAAKSATFDKNEAEALVFDAFIPTGAKLAATLNNGSVSGFTQADSYFTLPETAFAGLASGEYTVKISGCDNDVELRISVKDSTAPTMNNKALTFQKGAYTSYIYTWNLAEAAFDGVDGLNDNQYKAEAQGLTVYFDSFDFGTTEFTVHTTVNSFDLSVTINGAMSWEQSSYDFKVDDTTPLEFNVDMADKTFSHIAITKDGKELEIYPTQFRYNANVVTISNDFAYNLAAGTYSVSVYSTEYDEQAKVAGTYVSGGILNVLGKLKDYAQIDGCNGTVDAPYLIYNNAQFAAIVKKINQWILASDFTGVYFKLMADIDLNYAPIDPIGNEKHHFKGCFDGNGYSIQNIKINNVNDSYSGLFAYNDGEIKNVRIANISVEISKSGSIGIGLIAGYNSGTISNISLVGGSIKAESKSWQDIKNAFFDIGGVVGYNNMGTIKRVDCEVEITASVKGLKVVGIQIGGRKSYINVGAIVGYFLGNTDANADSGRVKNCNVTASIKATSDNDSVTSNGWYGNSNLTAEQIDGSMRRCHIYTED